MVLLPTGWDALHAPVANVFASWGPPVVWWGAAAILLLSGLLLVTRAPRWTVLLAAAGAVALAVAADGLVDDAYIQFRYAANLAAGHGMVFNPGERIEGASGGLWIAALAVGPLLGVDAGVWGRLLSLALTGLASLAAGTAVARIGGARSGARAALLWAALPTAAMYGATGLETSAYAAALWAALAAAAGGGGRAGWLSGAGVSLLRPEGLVLALASVPWVRRGGRALRVVVLGALAGAAVIALARLAYYGAALPRSVEVKGFTAVSGLRDGGRYLALAALEWWPLLAALPAIWRSRAALLPAIPPAAAWTALVVARGGDWMPGSRYLVPLLVLLAAAAALESRSRLVRWAPAALAAWGCLLLAPVSDARLALPGRLQRAMETHRLQSAWWEGLGAWLRGAVPPGTTLASGPSGALPYASRLRTFDMYGLCSVVTNVTAEGATGHRLWGLGAAVGRNDLIYTGRSVPQVEDLDAVVKAANASVADAARIRDSYRLVLVLHRPERPRDVVCDVVWVRNALTLRPVGGGGVGHR